MQALSSFFAGLGLFFCGVHFIGTNLVPLAGRGLRHSLTRLAGQRWRAALIGVLAGAMAQSANAVITVVSGLVGSGIVDKLRAVPIPTWSHVGTSVLVILVAIDLRVAASYMIAVAGFSVYFGLYRNDRTRHAMGVLLGIGMLFLGLQMMRTGAGPVRDLMIADGFIAYLQALPPALLALGAGLSLLCQSSSVASALAVAATAAGLFDFSSACWIVYGANLGSGLNYALLARTHTGDAAQIVLMQVVQKLAGFAAVLTLLTVEWMAGTALLEPLVTSLADTTAKQVAWVFLLYQIAGSTLCTLPAERIMRRLEAIAPPTAVQELSRPAYLIEGAKLEPDFALEMVEREELRLLERLPTMLDTIRIDATEATASADDLRMAGLAVTAAMADYLEAIGDGNPDKDDRAQIAKLQHRTSNLSAMHESLGDFVKACRIAQQWPSSGRVAGQMIESLHMTLTALADTAASRDPTDREFLMSLLGHRDELMERIRQTVLKEDPLMPPKAQEALFSATMLFERIIWLARRSATQMVVAGSP